MSAALGLILFREFTSLKQSAETMLQQFREEHDWNKRSKIFNQRKSSRTISKISNLFLLRHPFFVCFSLCSNLRGLMRQCRLWLPQGLALYTTGISLQFLLARYRTPSKYTCARIYSFTMISDMISHLLFCFGFCKSQTNRVWANKLPVQEGIYVSITADTASPVPYMTPSRPILGCSWSKTWWHHHI